MVQAGFDRGVYSVGGDEVAALTVEDPSVGSAEILDGITDVVGPVLNDHGRLVHEEFDR
jgi:hypothetical protein